MTIMSKSSDTVHRNCTRTYFQKALLAAGVASIALLPQAVRAADAEAASDAGSGEIIVTAQRREESISKVPISITSFTPKLMDAQGIRQIDDIARLTPSLRFTRTSGVTGNNGSNISIRGIASDVGAATTAIYIDDTPIQIRSVGYFSGNPYPRVFDLERVEVLRGPQGTLFGAGAEGGAVRFITPQPTFGDFKMYARSEVSSTEKGAPSYEGGFAAGGKISDTLAVRVSAWYRRDGGYIDQVAPQTNTVIKKDINSQDTNAARVAFTWKPTENFTLTPALYYQNIKARARNQFWEGYGDASNEDFKNGHTNDEPQHDRYYIPSLKAQYDFGKISLISNTSFFDRHQDQVLDYVNYLSFLRTGSPFGTYNNKLATNAFAALAVQQRNFTQEVRLQSYDEDSLIDWTVGGYYSRTKQRSTYYSASGLLFNAISRGVQQYLGRYNLYELITANDKQYAAYGTIDIKPFRGVKLSIGGRYTTNQFDFLNYRVGPVNSGVETTVIFKQKEKPFTPKFTASYQIDPDNMIYATASKGFRVGGAQPIVDKTFCAADLKTLQVTDSPTTYKSDSLWSYEAGSKNKLFGGKLVIDANAYLIKWKNIQQSIRLPTCGFTFIGNLGNATSKGTDISFSLTPVRGVQVGGSIGLNTTTYDDDVRYGGGAGVPIRLKDQHINGAKWNGTAFVQVDQPLSERMDGYVRADYSFTSKGYTAIPSSTLFGYDAGLPGLDRTDYVTLRAGIRLSGLDLSAFVNNLTNENTPLSRNHDGSGSPLYYVETYRPRTIGLTAQYRY